VNSFTLSPIIISERKSGKFVWQKKKEDLVFSRKKKKKKQSRERREKKQKKWNNEFLHALVIRFRRVV